MKNSIAENKVVSHWNAADWLIGLSCGLSLLLLSENWLADGYLSGSPFSNADFPDYCLGLISLQDTDPTVWPLKRSRLAALPAALASSELGVLGSLRFTARLSTALVGLGIYGWARSLGGRNAGVAAVGVALLLAPICLLPRLLSFYPFMTAILVLGAWLASVGLASSERKGLLAVGIACAAVLCIDARGLVWAAPWGLAGVLLAMRPSNGPQQLLLLFLPLILSIPVARWAYPENAMSLEVQMDARPLFYKADPSMSEHAPPYDSGGNFVWGYSPPTDWLTTARFILEQSQLDPPPDFPPADSRFTVDNRVKPLIPFWIATGVIAVFILRKQPRKLLAAVVSIAPFALAFRAQLDLAEIFLRFQAQLLPGLCVLAGICVGGGVDRIPLPQKFRRLQAPSIVLALLLLVSGVVSTPLSRHANWRRPWVSIDHLVRFHPDTPAIDLNEAETRCTQAMTEDQARGRWTPPSGARRTR